MYERILDKDHMPEITDIERFIGIESNKRLHILEEILKSKYRINRELRYPFGQSYGWGFKYSHKTKHLFYLFFERDALTATIQIGDKEVTALNGQLPSFSQKARLLWENRYPCGKDGGWIHYRILSDDDLDDIVRFIALRKKPVPVTAGSSIS